MIILLNFFAFYGKILLKTAKENKNDYNCKKTKSRLRYNQNFRFSFCNIGAFFHEQRLL